MTDIHANYRSIYGAEDAAVKGKPHGWIQWKGTNVCIDLHCPCGAHAHFDGEFFYAYECVCGKKYAVGQVVNLIELTPEQQKGYHEFQKAEAEDDEDPRV